MKKIHFIVNPSSGKEEAVDRVLQIVDCLDAKGYDTSTFYTEKKEDAKNDAQSIEREVDLIVAVGGDGTVNEVMQGLAGVHSNTPFTVYPQGTVNDFAHYIGIPMEPEAFVSMIERNHVIPLDIAKINGDYFMNVAAFGIASRIGHEVDTEQKTNFGRLAYIFEGLKLAPEFMQEDIIYTIESDTHEPIKAPLMFLAVTNSKSVGGFKQMAPHASISDGVFDVVGVKKMTVAKAGQVLLQLNQGTHVDNEDIIYFQATRLNIHTNPPTAVDIDGEEAGFTPTSIEVLPSYLRCLINH